MSKTETKAKAAPGPLALNTEEAAALVGVTGLTLATWRYQGTGPRYVKFRHRIRYRVADLEAWLAENTVDPSVVKDDPAAQHGLGVEH